MAALGGFLGSGGKNQETTTETNTNNLGSMGDNNTHSNLTLENKGKKSTVNVTMTDNGAVRDALSTVAYNNENAFNFADNITKESFDFSSEIYEGATETVNNAVNESLWFADQSADRSAEAIRAANETISEIAGNSVDSITKFAREAAADNHQLASDIKTGDLNLSRTMVLGFVSVSIVVVIAAAIAKSKRK
ncbi:hypothetical protein [Catenovulum agarivorans]|uniref:hypothetical protein n=1 Tax=Catenovulum agarivorans TaxID=1172192 RepID=UPI00031D93CD|nr:hypothetical protein [Catenovulum agarivorans]